MKIENEKIRLDKFISIQFNISREQAIKYIKNNHIYINRILINKPNKLINYNNMSKENIEIISNEKKNKITIEYIEENDNFLIVNKPYGLSVARCENTPKNEEVLNEIIKEKYSLSYGIRPEEYGIVHRIDKTTEGLMIIARNDQYYDLLLNLFQKQKVKKIYLAIVEMKKKHIKLEDEIILPFFFSLHRKRNGNL
jgi:23S rRNA pseudouridine1911/1915/1917 synthase